MGDRLLVGITPDDDAATYKRRPVLSNAERIDAVRALEIADDVFLSPCMRIGWITDEFLDSHGIDIVVYGSIGWEEYFKVAIERDILVRLPYSEGINTSEIITRIRDRNDF